MSQKSLSQAKEIYHLLMDVCKSLSEAESIANILIKDKELANKLTNLKLSAKEIHQELGKKLDEQHRKQ